MAQNKYDYEMKYLDIVFSEIKKIVKATFN